MNIPRSARKARAHLLRSLGLSRDPRQPSRALFAGIRRRLTLWYTAAIAVALVAIGVILYFEVQQQLLGPMNSELSAQARGAAFLWQQKWVDAQSSIFPLATTCPQFDDFGQGLQPNLLIACYDTKFVLRGTDVPFARSTFAPFLGSSLARSVSPGGSGGDTVTTSNNGEYASIQRYAIWVHNPVAKGWLGVIVVGLPVGGQGQALSTLLDLLLILGALTVLFSIGVGLFLASRALKPARVAYARQRDFIADASHELRTPLTMLRSTVEFVLRGRDHLPPEDVALLEDTVEETAHLTQLANNMLDLARLDSDNVHVEEEVVDLSDVAQEVVRWSRAMAQDRTVTVSVRTSEPVLVLGDGNLLEQAVLVLVDNAIKYNRPQGTVDVSVEKAGSQAIIQVRDTGIGVAPEHLNRLGERFYRIDKARSRESGGAGLGLSIVRSVVARHEGTFNLLSEPGTGTTASIRLPLLSDARFSYPEDDQAETMDAREATAREGVGLGEAGR